MSSEILSRCRAEIRKASKGPTPASDGSPGDGNAEQVPPLDEQSSIPAPPASSAHLARHAERSDRYQQLVELRKAGLTTKEMARRLGMGERTVRSWFTRGIPYGKPELRRKRRRGFDPYATYVTERWNQGCRICLQIWRELQAHGYKEVPEPCIGSGLRCGKVPLP